jgi:hypothetical protein
VTLTYVYADSTAVLGPLAPQVEPHSYDLCESHGARLTAPRGWELIRIETEVDPARTTEEIEAIANAVREQPTPRVEATPRPQAPAAFADAIGDGIQRGHLRSVPGVLPGMD